MWRRVGHDTSAWCFKQNLKTLVEIQPQASRNRTLVLVEHSADATAQPIKAIQCHT